MLSELIEKLILATLLSICLVFPVYKFIFILSARKYSEEDYKINKKKLKKRSLIYSTLITITFSFIYSIQVF